MEKASGELNLTVVTIIAIAAIAAFFTAILWPRIRNTINNNWESTNQTPDAEGNFSIVWE